MTNRKSLRERLALREVKESSMKPAQANQKQTAKPTENNQ